jgi:hypothetical protein
MREKVREEEMRFRALTAILTSLMIGALLGCGGGGGVSKSSPPPDPAKTLTFTAGGLDHRRTPKNYISELTVGAKTSSVSGTTAHGYKVRLDFQGQVVK